MHTFCQPVAAAAWLIVAAASFAAWATPAVFLPAHDLALRWVHTPPIGPDVTLAQTFEMPAARLHAVDIRAIAVGEPEGRVRLEIHDVSGHGDSVVRQTEVAAADLVAQPVYRFEFPALVSSKGTPYRLDVGSSHSAPARGIALWAIRGQGYREGVMLVNDIPRWGDLAFRTHAPVPSRWQIVVNVLSAQIYGIAFALIAYGGLLGVVMCTCARMLLGRPHA